MSAESDLRSARMWKARVSARTEHAHCIQMGESVRYLRPAVSLVDGLLVPLHGTRQVERHADAALVKLPEVALRPCDALCVPEIRREVKGR